MRGLASAARREVGRSRRAVDVAAVQQALAAYRSSQNGRQPVEQVARERLLAPGQVRRWGNGPALNARKRWLPAKRTARE
jgi:hypothetical protein